MNTFNPSIGSSSVLALTSLLEDYGYSQELISELSGIDLSALDSQDSRLPLGDYQTLWKTALTITNNPALGLELGQIFNASKIGIVGHIIFNSETLEEGLKEYVRLFSIVNEAISLVYHADEKYAYLRFVHLNPEYYCIPDMERSMVLSLYRGKALFDKDIKWESVDFQHAQPDYIDQYQKVFDCPLNFNQSHCQIVFERKYLELAPKQRNPFLGGAALEYANSLLKKLFKRTYADKVKGLIAQSISTGEADVDHIANQLNTSRQTLYRKLKAEGVSFQGLLEDVRFSTAKDLLKNSDQQLSEIAFSLGFSDLSAFSRAFKRWSGVTPKEYREG
ncbi:AraC family transcriptional regulator [Alkalimarinus sediminis]|uniref:AraC family transcriptional regulator n=1 Tax=Alkalimarinus sediminis TaxID=1632866 RepID=A0A9E8KNM2_9ALTE|nr:AraC family transcriptional regulator [Alkalimarinus sediminis]UZW73370.1 AraC family transcriptional regulator [Alkalimarinus sediminis]